MYQFELLRYDYPELEVVIRCSSGTYVRSLGRDLAASLGTAAVMSALVRTAVGSFLLEDAKDLGQLTTDSIGGLMLPISRAVEHLSRYDLSEVEARAVRHGRPIATSQGDEDKLFAGFDPQGDLVGILCVRQSGSMAPERVLPTK